MIRTTRTSFVWLIILKFEIISKRIMLNSDCFWLLRSFILLYRSAVKKLCLFYLGNFVLLMLYMKRIFKFVLIFALIIILYMLIIDILDLICFIVLSFLNFTSLKLILVQIHLMIDVILLAVFEIESAYVIITFFFRWFKKIVRNI